MSDREGGWRGHTDIRSEAEAVCCQDMCRRFETLRRQDVPSLFYHRTRHRRGAQMQPTDARTFPQPPLLAFNFAVHGSKNMR